MFTNEPKFETVDKAAHGIMATRLQQVGAIRHESLLRARNSPDVEAYSRECANAFNTQITSVARIYVESYKEALEHLGVLKPSKSLIAEVSKRIRSYMDGFVDLHRKQVAEFATHTNWPHPSSEGAIHAANAYVDGQLELLAHSPINSGPKSTENKERGGIAREYKVAILVAVLGVVAVGIQQVVWSGRIAARDRRVAEQQALKNELLPQIDSVERVAQDFEFQLGLKNDPMETHRLANAVYAAVKPLTAKMSIPARLINAFGYEEAIAYQQTETAAIKTADAATIYATQGFTAARKQHSLNAQPDQKFAKAYSTEFTKFEQTADKFEQLLINQIGK